MSGAASVGEFEQAIAWLTENWEKTADVWGDQVRQNFEGDYWAPLSQAASVFLEQLRELATVLGQVRGEVP